MHGLPELIAVMPWSGEPHAVRPAALTSLPGSQRQSARTSVTIVADAFLAFKQGWNAVEAEECGTN